ncbi:unnamed protein product [Sympodiomycopsis kandeliae]
MPAPLRSVGGNEGGRGQGSSALREVRSRESLHSNASGLHSQAHSVSVYSHESATSTSDRHRRPNAPSRSPSTTARVLPYHNTSPTRYLPDNNRYDQQTSTVDPAMYSRAHGRPGNEAAYESSAVRSSGPAFSDGHAGPPSPLSPIMASPQSLLYDRRKYSTHASSQLEGSALDEFKESVNHEVIRQDSGPALSPLPARPYKLSSQSSVALSSTMTKVGSTSSDGASKDKDDKQEAADTSSLNHPSPWVHNKSWTPDLKALGWHRYPFAVVDYVAAQGGLPIIPMTYTPGPAPMQLRPIWAFAGMVFLNSIGFILVLPWILIFSFLFLALGLASLPTIFLPLSIGRDLAPKLWTPLEHIFAYGATFGLAIPYTVLWLIYTILFVVFWPFNALFSLPCSQWLAKKLITRLSRLRWPRTSYSTRRGWIDAYFQEQPKSTDIVSMASDMFNNAWFFLLAWPTDIALRLTFTFLAKPQYASILVFFYIPGWTALSIFIMRKFKKWINFNFVQNVCQQAAPSIFSRPKLSRSNGSSERDVTRQPPTSIGKAPDDVFPLRPSQTRMDGESHRAITVEQSDAPGSYASPYDLSGGRGVYGHGRNNVAVAYGDSNQSCSTLFGKDISMDKGLLSPGSGRVDHTPEREVLASTNYDSRFVIGSDSMGSPIRRGLSNANGEGAYSTRYRGIHHAESPNVTLNLDHVVTRNDGGRISGDMDDAYRPERLPQKSRSSRSRGPSASGQPLPHRDLRTKKVATQNQQNPYPGCRSLTGNGGNSGTNSQVPSSDAEESFDTAHCGPGPGHGPGPAPRSIRVIHTNDQGFYT